MAVNMAHMAASTHGRKLRSLLTALVLGSTLLTCAVSAEEAIPDPFAAVRAQQQNGMTLTPNSDAVMNAAKAPV